MGGKFKAMTLISEAELERMRDRQLTEYNPSVRTMTKLQSLIDKVFEDKTLTPDEKQKVLNTLHERFSQLYSKYKNLASSASPISFMPSVTKTPSMADTSGTVTEDSEVGEEQSLDQESEVGLDSTVDTDSSFIFPEINLAARYSRKLGLFKNFLMENKNVLGSSAKNELVIDGKVIPNSSFSDLVRNMYIRGPKLNLTGSNLFMDKLVELKVDPTMFSNSDRILFLTPTSAVSKDFRTSLKVQTGKGQKRKNSTNLSNAPPGKLPHILRLFRI